MSALRRELSVDLLREFSARGAGDEVALWWTGQAGFLLRHREVRIGVDLYLSDSLARKYAGRPYPHRRMVPVPVAPGSLSMLDLVLCTHAHTDHMDPDTLAAIAAASPACRFVVPRAERAKALERGVPADRLIAVTAGDARTLADGVSLSVVPAAHEERQQDADGNEVFLGYVLRLGSRTLYHPGDCVPYEGQAGWLEPHAIDLALLPVNGRDAQRAAQGVPGNFHLDEAVGLCCDAGIPHMLGHHYGMFDFNTIDPDEGERTIARLRPPCRAGLARASVRYVLGGEPA